jgi:hypothetical protein
MPQIYKLIIHKTKTIMGRPRKNPETVNQETGLQTITPQEQYQIELASEKQKRDDFRRALEGFNKTLHRAPDPKKVLQHEGVSYIPISSIEKDLDKCFFGLVQYEIVSFQQILNEFVVHARIKVFHPVINQWLNYDGIGAGMFQQKAGTPIQDFFMYKRKDGGKLTAPNAYAAAIKNAAKKIGKRFGSDLARKIEDDYNGFYKDEPSEEKPMN